MDCYDRLISFYNENDNVDSDSAKVWLNSFLLRLMREFSERPDYNRVRNCLIILVNLFYQVDSPDHYHKKGKSTSELNKDDRDVLASLLKDALNN